jgi:hypothetical protein
MSKKTETETKAPRVLEPAAPVPLLERCDATLGALENPPGERCMDAQGHAGRHTFESQLLEDEAKRLDHFVWSHQIGGPWGQPTASWTIGAAGVKAIAVEPWGVDVHIERADGARWVLTFTNGGGYGWRDVTHRCEDCGAAFGTDVEAAAHARSHKPNHRGAEA